MSEQNQQDFWKEAGLTEEEFAKIKAEDLGLRHRRRDKEPKAPPIVQQPQKQRPARIPKAEAVRKDIPSTFEEFCTSYSSTPKSGTNEDQQWRQQNLSLLFEILTTVYQAGGIIQLLSVGGWSATAKELSSLHKQISDVQPAALLRIYVKHLVQFEFSLNGQQLTVKEGVELENSLTEALFIRGELAEIVKRPSQGLEILKEEVVVFPRGVEELGINYEDINLAKIEALCGDESLDIRVQHPMDYGFNINKMTNLCGKMAIKEYCEYQRNYKVQAFKKAKYGEQLKNGKVFFGVNFEPSSLDIFSSLWEKLQSNFLGFGQNFDLLSYLDSEIPGCSSPQFYLKVKGCWTGGHQENLAMCAVNINHGPDASEWFTIPYCQVERVRIALMEKFKMDLYKDEGLWYEKINWFIQNGYPIKRILQQQGDIVVSGPGTLHWVRSFGVALQSAWNIFPKNYNMIQCAMHRFQQNLAIRLERTSVIPFKALLIKYLEHQYQTINEKVLEIVIVNLEQWLSNQQRLRLELTDSCDLGLESAIEQRLEDLSSFCEICKQEVLNFYVYSWTGRNIACLQCLSENPALHNKSPIKLYFKYSHFHLRNLFDAAKNRSKTDKRTVGYYFCDGRHIGKVKCPIKDEEGTRKRERQPMNDYLTTESANEDSNPNEEVLEKILQYYESLSEESKKTLAEVVQAKHFKLSEHVKNKTIETQTEDLTCTNCCQDLNFQKMRQPTKRHRSNRYYEQMNKDEEMDRPLKDYQPKRHYQRSQKREDFSSNKDNERREESKDDCEKESRHQKRNEERQSHNEQRRDEKWKNERNNRDLNQRGNHNNEDNRDNRHQKESRENGGYRNNRDDRDSRNNRRDHENQGNRGRDHQGNYRNQRDRRPYNDSKNRDRPTNERSDYKREEPKAITTKANEQAPFDY